MNFRNKLIFYSELLAPRPTTKLEDHPLSSVRDCLFNIFPPYLEAVPSIRNLRTRHAVVSRDPPNMKLIIMHKFCYFVRAEGVV
jgi:hypothetical protein